MAGRGEAWVWLVVDVVGVWPADVHAGQSACYGADYARRPAVQLGGGRLAPDAGHHNGQQDQDEPAGRDNEDDQGGKHQLSTPLPMAWSSAIALARMRVPSWA
jgi:hypothetical protein